MTFDFRKELGKMTPRITKGAKIYIFGAGGNWEWICKEFKFIAGINIDNYIDGFIDNDVNKQHTVFHGNTVYPLSEIDAENAVILISIHDTNINNTILEQLKKHNLFEFNAVFRNNWSFDILMKYSYERFLTLKNIHKDERCFIIGNGPSISMGDLDKLKNEITFGVNDICLTFDKTMWRPSYYICMNNEIYMRNRQDIEKNIRCPIFTSYDMIMRPNICNLKNIYICKHEGKPIAWQPWKNFSGVIFSEMPFVLQNNNTTVYSCLQFAAYMGFKEIILLGLDNDFEHSIKFHKEPMILTEDILHKPIDIINSAYELAREYCDANNIRIRNATRGGNMEIFERVDFDSLL